MLFYGKLQYLKGPDLLIKAALRLITENRLALSVDLAGQDVRHPRLGSTRNQLHQLIPQHLSSRFRFLGRIDPASLEELALTCDVAVIPSRAETFCLAAHELNWIGIPLILTRLPAFIDHFHEGTSCRFFDGSVDDLARVLGEFLQGHSHPQALHQEWNVHAETGLVQTAYQQALKHRVPVYALKPIQTPSTSVIVTCAQDADALSLTLHSLMDSETAPTEVAVVLPKRDPARTRVVKLINYQATGECLRVLPVGDAHVAASIDSALANVTGDYVVLLADGDVIGPEFLRKGISILEADPSLVAVSPYAICLDGPGWSGGQGQFWIPCPLDPVLIALDNVVGRSGILFRRASLDRLGFDDRRAGVDETWLLWMALAEKGARTTVLPEVMVRRRAEGQNQMRQPTWRKATPWLKTLEKVYPIGLAEHRAEITSAAQSWEAYMARETSVRGRLLACLKTMYRSFISRYGSSA